MVTILTVLLRKGSVMNDRVIRAIRNYENGIITASDLILSIMCLNADILSMPQLQGIEGNTAIANKLSDLYAEGVIA